MDITTLRVSKSTRDKLAEFGKKNETYDDIVLRLLKKVFEEDKGK